jgi:peptidoglycan-associated lipoprotein
VRTITLTILLAICSSCACSNAHVIAASTGAVRAEPTRAALDSVHFATAGTRVVARDVSKLQGNAIWIRRNSDAVIVIEGHCDERGSDELNTKLGDLRARSVAALLAEMGTDASRLIIVSRGKSEPVDARHMESAWRKNRRVEFVVR